MAEISISKTHVAATYWLQVEPRWGGGNPRVLVGAKATRLSQNRPDRPGSGTVLVKMTVMVPRSAFQPLRPEAVVVVPDGMAETIPIHVEALPPGDQ